jgi:5-methylcytosine-specific restriction endonuclease McrA
MQLQMSVRQFFGNQRREDERAAADIRLQELQTMEGLKLKGLQLDKEIELKEKQLDKEIELKEKQSAEELRAKEHQIAEELKIKVEELRAKEHQIAEELKIKAEELRAKERQMEQELRIKMDEFRLKERQASEDYQLKCSTALEERHMKEHRMQEELRQQDKKIEAEIKLKEEEASASIRLLSQQTQTAAAHTTAAEKEAEAATLKAFRLSKQKVLLCDSDRRSALLRKFPKTIGARCDVVGCNLFVCAFKCSIVELPGYRMGEADKLQVVCIEHAKAHAKSHMVDFERYKLNTWVFREGGASHTNCALCGKCELAVWYTEAHVCHVNPRALGGRCDNDNLVIGSAGCNQQQGMKTLEDYQEQIRKAPIPKQVRVPEVKLDAVLNELLRRDKRSCRKCPLERMKSIISAPPKPEQVQRTVKRMMGKKPV